MSEIYGFDVSIDYKHMFDFMNKYSNHNYAQIDKLNDLVLKNIITQAQANEIIIIKKDGEESLRYLENLAERIKEIYKVETGRVLKKTGSNKFNKQNTQAPTGCVVRPYLWYQLIDDANSNKAYSLSIFVERDQNGKQRVRICIERDNKKGQNGIADQRYDSLKNINSSSLDLVAGSNEKNNIQTIIDPKDINQKIQLSKIIERDDNLRDIEYTQKLIEGLKLLIPYYEYVIGISNMFGKEIQNNKENIVEEEDNNMNKKISLNTILYGPPGTGKTYNSKTYAVAICNYNGDLDAVKSLDYINEVIPQYNKLVEEGRVSFTTFHQSYGYEEFIEGIKPILKDDDSKDVYYDVVPGTFKKFCEDAIISGQNVASIGIDDNAPIWKMSLYGGKTNIIQECFDEGYLRIGFEKDSDDNSMKLFKNEMHAGDIVLSLKSFYEINGIAQILDDDIIELNNKAEFKIAKKVKWLFKNTIINIKEINGGKRLPIKTCSGLPNINRAEVFKLINKELGNETKVDVKPYVFIIDEINRGNISKIFGELITLIEPSKRDGAKEAMSCILPYSHNKFSVPNNVYILGTMNTADRSIALMDTALRRRFVFVEMMPELKPLENLEVLGIKIDEMLKVLNSRIEVLYDREHTLGHAFFMDLWKDNSIEKLASIFENNIIPLLQEYFYEDYEKIQLVLGDNDKTDDKYKFIKDIKVESKNIFKGKYNDDDLPEKKYVVNKEAFMQIESYKQIM